MSQPNGPVCPECGTPRASGGTPACSCALRASEARRDARTAEAAAAEDFDPVRIRPFVELGAETEAVTPSGEEAPPESGNLADPGGDPTPPAAEETAPVPDSGDPQEDFRQRRRRTLLITGAVAALAVLLTSAFLGWLFLYDSPSRDRAASDDLRAPVPDVSTDDGTSPEGQSAGTASASPSQSPTSSPGAPSSGTPAPPTAPTTPTAPPSSAGATTGPAPAPTDAEGQPPVLRRGDQGPEVTELQLRLRQIGLYGGDSDGDFDREVESGVRTYQLTRVVLGDESGVYGTATRTSLESETSEP